MEKKVKILFKFIVVLSLLITLACSGDENSTKPSQVASPVFSHLSGTYGRFLQVSIFCSTVDSIIRYTRDGSEPTELSLLYLNPIDIQSDVIIKARAFKQDASPSEIITVEYVLDLPTIANPTFSPLTGAYYFSQEIIIDCTTPNVEIYYTTDESQPTELSELYNAPINIFDDTIIKAKAYKSNYFSSEIVMAEYIINTPLINIPNPADNATNISLTPTLSWEIHTANKVKSRNLAFDVFIGTSDNPSLVSSNQTEQYYTSSELNIGEIYYWKVVIKGGESDIEGPLWSFTTRYSPTDTVANPIFNPSPGFYDEAQFVEISSTTPGANIYFTLDASEPTELSQLYINPITVSTSKTIKARGFKNNNQASEIVTGDYTINEDFIPGFVYVAGGSFNNGTADVTLSSFYMSKYELTQAEYQAMIASNPSNFSGTDKPVEQVTWLDAVQYCNARSIEEGLTPCYDTSDWSCDFSTNGYRLPTEMEWMYAAKGGNQQAPSGYNQYAGTDEESQLTNYAWYSVNNSPDGTKDVGTKEANELGLYDMSGNVYEWCYDWYGDYNSSAQINPAGPSSGSRRVLRGGAWSWSSSSCRVVKRYSANPDDNEDYAGFRLVRSSD